MYDFFFLFLYIGAAETGAVWRPRDNRLLSELEFWKTEPWPCHPAPRRLFLYSSLVFLRNWAWISRSHGGTETGPATTTLPVCPAGGRLRILGHPCGLLILHSGQRLVHTCLARAEQTNYSLADDIAGPGRADTNISLAIHQSIKHSLSLCECTAWQKSELFGKQCITYAESLCTLYVWPSIHMQNQASDSSVWTWLHSTSLIHQANTCNTKQLSWFDYVGVWKNMRCMF